MRISRVWPLIRRVWIALGLSALILFTGWSGIAYRASPAARVALRTDSVVVVEETPAGWSFLPASDAGMKRVGLLILPGALVDPAAYAPLAREAALAGYPARVIKMPKRGAFGGAEDPRYLDRVRSLLDGSGEPPRWVLAGHSRGGVVASTLALEAPPGLAALVLIGTSHPRDFDLSSARFPVAKVVGTRDGLATPDEVRENRHLLPRTTLWVWIDGGNHSHFGWYGLQPGDRRAAIPASTQRKQLVAAVLEALRSASPE